jgi:hypothetical protein
MNEMPFDPSESARKNNFLANRRAGGRKEINLRPLEKNSPAEAEASRTGNSGASGRQAMPDHQGPA